MTLARFCKWPVITASPEDNVLHAALLMREKKIGAVVMVDEDRPIGILTDRDILLRVMTDGKDASTTKIRDVMTKNPFLVSEGIGIWELIQTMKKNAVRRYPVVSGDGKLVGIITMDDLIELLGTELSGMGSAIAAELGHEKSAVVTA